MQCPNKPQINYSLNRLKFFPANCVIAKWISTRPVLAHRRSKRSANRWDTFWSVSSHCQPLSNRNTGMCRAKEEGRGNKCHLDLVVVYRIVFNSLNYIHTYLLFAKCGISYFFHTILVACVILRAGGNVKRTIIRVNYVRIGAV